MTFFRFFRKTENLIPLLMILMFATLNLSSVRREFSKTNDEDKHYLYGERIASGDSTRFDDSKMPVTGLNALPKKIASFLDDGKIKQVLSRFYVARSVTILFSCLLAFLVFYWARLLYGFIPALFSLALYILDPNIIAHSQLVTTDLYVILAICFAFFSLWKFLNNRTIGNGVICMLALGLSQVAKYTSIVLFPLFIILLFIFDAFAWKTISQERKSFGSMGRKYAQYGIYTLVVVILVINIGFLFNNTFTYFGEYNFISSVLKNIQSSLPMLHGLPIPVPYPYLQGFDYMISTEQTGNFSGNIYLLGQVSTLDGFPGYFFIASLLKVPIATQIVLLIAFIAYFSKKEFRKNLVKNEMFLLVPVLFFTIYFNFFFNTQVGIRYYLPVFPLLYIFAGNLFVGWKDFTFFQKASSYVAIIYLSISVLSYYPYHISYFNEIILDRKQAYKYLADSNIDWGQNKNELDKYLLDHPDALYKPSNIRSGHLIVRVNDLVGVTAEPEKYAWLRNNFEPTDTIAYSYLIYKISPDEIENLCASTDYCDR